MDNKITLPLIAARLSKRTGISKRGCEEFVREMASLVSETLAAGESVKVANLGSFRLVDVEARASIDVATGEQIEIPGHRKVVFTPDKSLADEINAPFAPFEPMEIPEEASAALLGALESQSPAPELPESATEPAGATEGARVASADSIAQVEQALEKSESSDMVSGETLDAEPSLDDYAIEDEEMGENAEGEAPDAKAGNEGEIANEPLNEEHPNEPLNEGHPNEPLSGEVLADSKSEDISDEHRSEDISAERDNQGVSAEPQAEEARKEPQSERKSELRMEEDNYPSRPRRRTADSKEHRGPQFEETRRKIRFGWGFIVGFACCLVAFGIGAAIYFFALVDRTGSSEPAAYVPPIVADEPGLSLEEGNASEEESVPVVSASTAAPNAEGRAQVPTQPSDSQSAQAYQSAQDSQASQGSQGSRVAQLSSNQAITDTITRTRYLTTMAKQYYGNYNLWPYIYMENQSFLGHPDRIKPGTKVVVPPLSKYGVDPKDPAQIEKARKMGVEIYNRFK